jgi:hypothetical protein
VTASAPGSESVVLAQADPISWRAAKDIESSINTSETCFGRSTQPKCRISLQNCCLTSSSTRHLSHPLFGDTITAAPNRSYLFFSYVNLGTSQPGLPYSSGIGLSTYHLSLGAIRVIPGSQKSEGIWIISQESGDCSLSLAGPHNTNFPK